MNVTSDAVVVTTDSRAESATEAYRRVKATGDRYRDYFIYKKVDSTLRGNVAAELQALLDVTAAPHAVVCPAFPAIKRTVVNGTLLVDGVPVQETSFSRDPVSPVTHSDILELLRAGSGIAASNLKLEDVERGPEHLLQRIRESAHRAVVVDASEDRHLECIAAAVAASPERLLPCGSGGLMAHIPPAFGHSIRGRELPPAPDGPCSGGRQPQRRERPAAAARAGHHRSPAREGRAARVQEQSRSRVARQSACSADRPVVLAQPVVVLSSSLSDYSPQLRHTMAPVLGAVVSRVLATCPLGGLFLSGGDVARSVCGERRGFRH